MRRIGVPPAPMILGFILGSLLESNLRRGLMLAGGDVTTFFTRPISLTFLILTGLFCITPYFTKRLRISR
jgi:putative tricarboxylic transport membrane protein